MGIRIDPGSIEEAKSAIDGISDDYQASAKFPSLSFTNAAAAEGAIDSLEGVWVTRLRQEGELVEALLTALDSAAEFFARADMAHSFDLVAEEGDE